MILEKAYSKVHGSFLSLRGGFASDGLMDLTGCPTECFDFEDPLCIEMFGKGEFFQILQGFKQRGCLLSASTEGEETWSALNPSSKDLLAGHAYTILQVVQS